MRSNLCETGPVMLHRGICSFTDITHQWVLLRATLCICAEALWLSWKLIIDAFCLSTAIFYFIDLLSALIRWGIPKIPFSNVLPRQIGCLELNCDTFWDAGAHEPPLSFVSDLYSSLSEQVFRLCDFFILSGFSSNSDCWLLWWGLKTHFVYPSFSHSWTMTGQEVLWFSTE